MASSWMQPDAAVLAQMLGVPLFQTPLHMPQYGDGEVGPWRITRGAPGLDRGYYSGPCVTSGSIALLRKNDAGAWDTWMSLSPFEIESQELACRHAFGHVAVMGLGMGWVAVNIALNPSVKKVTVIERDPAVLELFRLCKVLDGLAPEVASKIELVQADALQWKPQNQAIDFLYADIWLGIEEPQALAQMQAMQANVQAKQVYFWGQELALAKLAKVVPGSERWPEALSTAINETQLPLLNQVDGGFAPWVERIWALRNPAKAAQR